MRDGAVFEQERARLVRIAEQLLREPSEAEDIVQQAWIRWHGSTAEIENLAGWLTTVTVHLCLDRLRVRTPLPQAEIELAETAADPAEEVLVAADVGVALLAPEVVVAGDHAAVAAGTPARLEGRRAVAEMFNGAARSALPVFVDERPGAAWFDRGVARVAFDFTIYDGLVHRIDFRADADALNRLRRRRGKDRVAVTPAARRSSSR